MEVAMNELYVSIHEPKPRDDALEVSTRFTGDDIDLRTLESVFGKSVADRLVENYTNMMDLIQKANLAEPDIHLHIHLSDSDPVVAITLCACNPADPLKYMHIPSYYVTTERHRDEMPTTIVTLHGRMTEWGLNNKYWHS